MQKRMASRWRKPGRFYRSELYKLMSEGVSDMRCMSDEYLVWELERRNQEYKIACFCEQAE